MVVTPLKPLSVGADCVGGVVVVTCAFSIVCAIPPRPPYGVTGRFTAYARLALQAASQDFIVEFILIAFRGKLNNNK